MNDREEFFHIPEERLAISHCVDVVVIGGGPAGIAAALAAARNGANILLIEQRGYLGGMGTAALVPAFCPFTDGEKPVVRGIGLELLNKMKVAAGAEYQNTYKDQLDWVPIDAEALKRVYDNEVVASGVKALFHTMVEQVIVEDDEIKGIVVINKSGRSVVAASHFIDTTGDADIAARVGAPFQKGDVKTGEMQPATMCYVLADANKSRFEAYLNESGDTPQIPLAVEKGQEDRALPPGRKKVSGFAWMSTSIVGVNFGHLFEVDGTDAESLTKAAIEGRKLVERQVSFLRKYVPGFERVRVVQTGEQVGIRETRRIEGEYVVTADDFMNMRSFEDDIARNAYFIDIHLAKAEGKMTIQHLPKGKSHGIPYRSLLPKGIQNLIVAGRSVSADRVAQSSMRVMPNCFAMGQAAGIAAVLANRDCVGFREISVKELQELLVEQGAWIET